MAGLVNGGGLAHFDRAFAQLASGEHVFCRLQGVQPALLSSPAVGNCDAC